MLKLNIQKDDISVQETPLSKYIKNNASILEKHMDSLMMKVMQVSKVEFTSNDPMGESYHKSSMFFHIVLDSTIIGYFVCTPGQFKGTVWISEFYIEDLYRGKGYGKTSIEALKIILKAKKYNKICLTYIEGNTVAEKLYRKTGFTTTICTSVMATL